MLFQIQKVKAICLLEITANDVFTAELIWYLKQDKTTHFYSQ